MDIFLKHGHTVFQHDSHLKPLTLHCMCAPNINLLIDFKILPGSLPAGTKISLKIRKQIHLLPCQVLFLPAVFFFYICLKRLS